MDYENRVVQFYRGILDSLHIKKYARNNGSLLTEGEADKLKVDELQRELFGRPPASLEEQIERSGK